MKVNSIVSRLVQKVTPYMHSVRRAAFSNCVDSLLTGQSATITQIGRGLSSNTFEKHNIKRVDRMCSNVHLLCELNTIYQSIIHQVITPKSQPIILVDWSDLDDRLQHFLLRASLVYQGRALTLYEQVHDLKTKDKPATHRQFLNVLQSLLPAKVKPIIVTDAGFRGPWFKLIQSLGWHFVGRVRNKTQYRYGHEQTDQWEPIRSLYTQATHKPQFLGEVYLAKLRPTLVNLVLYKKKLKGRHRFTRKGKVAQWTNSKLASQREKEPWLLATSLEEAPDVAKKVIAIYRSRMQIEEAFRDTKSTHYGLGFSASQTRQKARLSVLLALCTVTSFVALLIGMLAENEGLHRRYQSNTIADRRVLSLHYLGLRVYQRNHLFSRHYRWSEVLSLFIKYASQWQHEL